MLELRAVSVFIGKAILLLIKPSGIMRAWVRPYEPARSADDGPQRFPASASVRENRYLGTAAKVTRDGTSVHFPVHRHLTDSLDNTADSFVPGIFPTAYSGSPSDTSRPNTIFMSPSPLSSVVTRCRRPAGIGQQPVRCLSQVSCDPIRSRA